ncbi:MAG: hypothetical protein BGN96_00405 [Bacteroidales bacterium 45-6]|nr:MAG: hypothetical protein BGN96_00405 [Bacteroidales bacterium 45-6]
MIAVKVDIVLEDIVDEVIEIDDNLFVHRQLNFERDHLATQVAILPIQMHLYKSRNRNSKMILSIINSISY